MNNELLQALRDSEAKYVGVIKEFKAATPDSYYAWFSDNCSGDTCALCKYFGGKRCGDCPLYDGLSCCDEWQSAGNAAYSQELTAAHLEAILERIRREIRKLEGES